MSILASPQLLMTEKRSLQLLAFWHHLNFILFCFLDKWGRVWWVGCHLTSHPKCTHFSIAQAWSDLTTSCKRPSSAAAAGALFFANGCKGWRVSFRSLSMLRNGTPLCMSSGCPYNKKPTQNSNNKKLSDTPIRSPNCHIEKCVKIINTLLWSATFRS